MFAKKKFEILSIESLLKKDLKPISTQPLNPTPSIETRHCLDNRNISDELYQQIQAKDQQIKNILQEKEKLANEYKHLLRLLFLAGIDINTLDVQALIYSAGRGDNENVKTLLEAEVNPKGQDSQALIVATKEGHLETVKILLEAGADPKAQDSQALIVAAQGGHVEVVKLLLEAGADPRAQYSQALLNAAWNQHTEIANLLRANGADPTLFSRIYKLSWMFVEEARNRFS